MTTKVRNNGLPITDYIGHIYDLAFRRKRLMENAMDMSKSISPWLHDLYAAYMGRGQYPVLPYIINEFYTDYNDEVIATLIACLCLNVAKVDHTLDEVAALRRILGAHPYQDFFVNRGFVLLSLPEHQSYRLNGWGSTRVIDISLITEGLWNVWDKEGRISLRSIFKMYVTERGYRPTEALRAMLGDGATYVRLQEYRLNLTLMALCSTYGIGIGAWNFNGLESELSMPQTVDTERFFNLLVPNRKLIGTTPKDIANIMGFKNAIDMWYLYNAYRELLKTSMTQCTKFMRRYHAQYKHNRTDSNNRGQLKLLEPKIEFLNVS